MLLTCLAKSRRPEKKKLNSSTRALEYFRVILSYRAIQSYYVKEQRQESVRLPFVVYQNTKSNSMQMLSRCLRTQDRRHRVACGEHERNLALLASLSLRASFALRRVQYKRSTLSLIRGHHVFHLFCEQIMCLYIDYCGR